MTISTEIEYKNYYVEKLYLTANVETGVIVNRSGRRMIALTNDFLLGLHRALEKECGDRVGHVLHHCGRKWGKNFGKCLDDAWSEFYQCPSQDFPLSFFQSLLVQEFGHNGWGILEIDYTHFAKGVIGLGLDGSIMADITEQKLDYPADMLTGGIFAGMFTHFIGREIDSVQSQCSKQGLGESRFLLSDRKESKIYVAGTLQENHIKNYSSTFCPFNHKSARKPGVAFGGCRKPTSSYDTARQIMPQPFQSNPGDKKS